MDSPSTSQPAELHQQRSPRPAELPQRQREHPLMERECEVVVEEVDPRGKAVAWGAGPLTRAADGQYVVAFGPDNRVQRGITAGRSVRVSVCAQAGDRKRATLLHATFTPPYVEALRQDAGRLDTGVATLDCSTFSRACRPERRCAGTMRLGVFDHGGAAMVAFVRIALPEKDAQYMVDWLGTVGQPRG